jgi:adenine phosphoribosyltransferase
MQGSWRVMNLDKFKKSLQKSSVIKKGEYHYIIHPIADGIPEIKPGLLHEIVGEMKRHIQPLGHIDRIVTIEAMGIPIATALSLDLHIPFTIIRKRKYGLKDEITIEQETGYSKSKLYINGVKKGQNIIIVDDLISTGDTLQGILSAFTVLGVNIKGIFVAINKKYKSEHRNEIDNKTVVSLASIDIINGKIVVQ